MLDGNHKLHSKVKSSPINAKEQRRLEERYASLARQLSDFGSLSQGSVMAQPPAAWRWTRKVKGKTISLGLTASQAQRMKQAITNQRGMDEIIDEMREITQTLILADPGERPTQKGKNHPKQPLT